MVSKKGCLGWLQKRTNLEKTLLSLSSLLLLTLLLMILFGVTYHGKKSENNKEEDTACLSLECIQIAGQIISTMDSKADSCSNFYDFSCGKYGQEPEQIASISKRTRDTLYLSLKDLMESSEKMNISGLDNVRRFYSSCVNFGNFRQDVEETKESFLNLMSELGVGIWPIIDPLYDIEEFSLEHTLSSLILLDVPVVFRMEVIPDELLKGSYLIKISPGGPRESGRSPSDIRNDIQLRFNVLTSLLLLGASASNTDVYDILAVDSNFATIEQDVETACDEITLAPQDDLSELNRLIPEINWAIIMSQIRNATGLVRPFAVELHCRQKIRDYVVQLNDLPLRSGTNYLGWRFFSKFVDHVIPAFKRSQFRNEEAIPRWRICLELLEKYSSPILAEALSKKIISNEIQTKVQKISKAVLDAAQTLVSRPRWLSEPQKSKIREKVARIKMRYPFQAMDEISNLSILPEVHVTNFTAVAIRLQRRWVIRRFKVFVINGETSSAVEPWTSMVSPTTDMIPSDETIFVYFDKIQNPYLRLHGPQWMSFGGYGVFLAREVSKILMAINLGTSDYDTRNLWSLWINYKNSSSCFLKSQTSHPGANLEVSASHMNESMRESMFLDHSAIEITYESARSTAESSKSLPGLDLNDEKMFFLSYAQTLCNGDASVGTSENIPFRERFNSVIANVKSFREVFSCTPSTTHCEIWT